MKNFTAPKMWADHRHELVMATIKPLDELVRKLELKWGVNRLPKLVSPTTASKFELAKQNYDNACLVDDHNKLIQKAENMMRGWKVLDKEAIKLGHKPYSSNVWSFDLEGERICICLTESDYNAINEDDFDRIYTLNEIALLILSSKSSLKELHEIKKQFKDSTITNVRKLSDKNEKETLNDEIPF